ncbi:hypothetical protein G7Z17_g4489 [Cylindrodendrum hubeiense]|uniref:DUF6604 domain-containing protein n=1 Tax=Cylindrodendrum hubeiense TaxID=595255 RepID=A0A9P5H8S0_9HYPO|nr:hypothetical protein G7Z17_g4489 [Cylindrodendrum hubeiense]
MLPSSLISVDQEYKKYTDSVASWLASTAKRCGYPADLLTPVNSQPKADEKPKAKARKRGKRKGKVPAPAARETGEKHIIAINDFIPLAEFIFSTKKPLILVPDSFSKTIDRVIAVRSSFGTQLSEHGMETAPDSDLKHFYFVGILEKVREVLRPRMSTKTMPTSSDSPEMMTTRFSGLQVYEPSQEFLDAPNIERPEKSTEDMVTYEAELQNRFEDAIMAFAMMLDDLDKIRSRIKWIWSNYRDGFSELATAAVATNTALDLARNLMEDVLPIFKDHGGALDVCKKLFFMIAHEREGCSLDETLAWFNGATQHDFYEIADETYLNAGRLIESFAKVLSPQNIPIYKEGMLGVYDPESNRDVKTGHEKFTEDNIILTEFFPEAVALARLVPDYPVEDEFIRGIKELDQTQEVSFPLVFATQAVLDIHHILRSRAKGVVSALIQEVSAIGNMIDGHFKYHQNLESPDWPESNENMLRRFRESITWFTRDPVYVAKKKFSRKSDIGEPREKYRLLGYSPILAGLALYHFRAGMFELGIAISNAWGSITYTAHLYNAVQQERLLKDLWVDMEVVLTNLGDSTFFVGRRPRNTSEYLKRFSLQMGTSASVVTNSRPRAPNRIQRLQDVSSRAGPRWIKGAAPVSSLFMEIYLRKGGQVDWTPEHVDNIISRSQNEVESTKEDGTLILAQIDDPERLKQKRRAHQETAKKRRRNISDGGRLSPSELVKSLALSMQAEALEFTFPYMDLHRWCWGILRIVKTHCDAVLRTSFGPTYLENESQLPFVVGYIFRLADGANVRKDVTALRMAAEVIADMIAVGTGEFLVGMMEKTSGFGIDFQEEE